MNKMIMILCNKLSSSTSIVCSQYTRAPTINTTLQSVLYQHLHQFTRYTYVYVYSRIYNKGTKIFNDNFFHTTNIIPNNTLNKQHIVCTINFCFIRRSHSHIIICRTISNNNKKSDIIDLFRSEFYYMASFRLIIIFI